MPRTLQPGTRCPPVKLEPLESNLGGKGGREGGGEGGKEGRREGGRKGGKEGGEGGREKLQFPVQIDRTAPIPSDGTRCCVGRALLG